MNSVSKSILNNLYEYKRVNKYYSGIISNWLINVYDISNILIKSVELKNNSLEVARVKVEEVFNDYKEELGYVEVDLVNKENGETVEHYQGTPEEHDNVMINSVNIN